jgi:hypothetical protein
MPCGSSIELLQHARFPRCKLLLQHLRQATDYDCPVAWDLVVNISAMISSSMASCRDPLSLCSVAIPYVVATLIVSYSVY